MAKIVLKVILVYPMMINNLSKACIKDIHRLQQDFIWRDTKAKRIYHAINWDTATTCKHEGGLGLNKLDQMNKAYGMKLV